MPRPTRMLTVAEVAAHVQLSPDAVRRLLRRRVLRGVQTRGNGPWQIPEAEVLRLLARHVPVDQLDAFLQTHGIVFAEDHDE